jgi:hypothetical protein
LGPADVSQAVTDLLRFYVIFRPVEAQENVPSSPCQTVLSKSMDDSLQYRCTGTIQAAVEKYIDHIGGKPPVRGSDASSVLSDLDDEPKKDKKSELRDIPLAPANSLQSRPPPSPTPPSSKP